MSVSSRVAPLIVTIFALLVFAMPAVGQTWTSANGKFTVEAEFVELKDGKVRLKRLDRDSVLTVKLKDLSKEDQERAKQLQKEAGEANENDLLGQIDLDCTAELKKSMFSGEDPQVIVSIVASGVPAADAIMYGKVKLSKFTDESDKKLTQEEDRFSMNDISKSFKKVERGSMFSNHPDGCVGVELKLPADSVPASIGKLMGSFSILTGGERTVEATPNLSEFFGKSIKSEVLKKAKIKIAVEKPSSDNGGYGLSFNVTGNLNGLNRIWIADSEEQELDEQQGNSSSSSGKQANFSFFFSEDVSETAVLYFETVEGAVEVKIPFEFSDIEITKPLN